MVAIKDMSEQDLIELESRMMEGRKKRFPVLRDQALSFLKCGDPTDPKNLAGLYYPDLLAVSTCNSMLRLSRGLEIHLADKNIFLSCSMIRMMVDTLFVYFGLWQVKDHFAYCKHIHAGGEIREIKDRNGKALSYTSLAKELDKQTLQAGQVSFLDIYRTTCKFIHFSEYHFGSHVKIGEKDEQNQRSLEMSLSDSDEPMQVFQICEMLATEAMCYQSLMALLRGWTDAKSTPPNTTK